MNQKKMSDGKRTVTVTVIVIGIVVFGTVSYFRQGEPEPSRNDPVMIPESAGEIPSAYQGDGASGLSPVEPTSETGRMIAIPPEPVMFSDEGMIREALIAATGISGNRIIFLSKKVLDGSLVGRSRMGEKRETRVFSRRRIWRASGSSLMSDKESRPVMR